MQIQSILPEQLHQLGEAGRDFDLIDVRTPEEFADVHAKGAVNMPLGTFDAGSAKAARKAPDESSIYIICRSGGRSATACQQLLGSGLNVVNVEGGTLAWQRAGLPVVRGQIGGGRRKSRVLRPMGFLLAIALLVLGFTVHPAFGFAAAGLWFTIVVTSGCPFNACAMPPPNRNTDCCN